MLITDEWLTTFSSHESGNGWTAVQFAILGIPWPPPSGWKETVIGKELSEADGKRFEEISAQRRASLWS